MTDPAWAAPPPRAELIARIREGLGSLGTSLRVVAEDLLGAEARIDLVALDPDGRLHLVLATTEADDLALVALGLAQRAWVEARLPDWLQLAPGLGLRAGAPVRVVLVAPAFSPTAEAAVRAAGPEGFDLVRYRCLSEGPGRPVRVLLEPDRLEGRRAGPLPHPGPPAASRFRTGLADEDLVVSGEERRFLGGSRAQDATAEPRGEGGDEKRRSG